MNIIFSDQEPAEIKEKHVVLELDTFVVGPEKKRLTSWCVVENIDILEMHQIDQYRDLHRNLMLEYRKRSWKYCADALEHLQGRWRGELDSFYAEMSKRIAQFESSPPDNEWDGTIIKDVKS